MPQPWFAVVGSGRSGTGFMSRLLRSNGLRCGHEAYWSPLRLASGTQFQGLDGDSSWLAVPYLEEDRSDIKVLHVVRDPVDVVKSLLEIRFFHSEAEGSPFQTFARNHSEAFSSPDPMERAVDFWVEWNRRCLALADLSVKLERLPFLEISKLLGRSVRSKGISKKYNHNPKSLHAGRVADSTPNEAIRKYLDGREQEFGY